MTIFYQAHQKIIKSTFSFPEFAPAWKNDFIPPVHFWAPWPDWSHPFLGFSIVGGALRKQPLHLCNPILLILPVKWAALTLGTPPPYIYTSMLPTSSEWTPPPPPTPHHWVAPSCTIVCRGVSTCPYKINTPNKAIPPLKMNFFGSHPKRATLPPENENVLTSP